MSYSQRIIVIRHTFLKGLVRSFLMQVCCYKIGLNNRIYCDLYASFRFLPGLISTIG